MVPLARCPDKRWLATETFDIFLLRNSLQFEEGRRDLIWTVPKPVGIKEPRIVKSGSCPKSVIAVEGF